MGGASPRAGSKLGYGPPIDRGFDRKTKDRITILFLLNVFESWEEIRNPINI
jgi:hypothetical protein